MRKLDLIPEPPELSTWKSTNPDGVYDDLEEDPEVRIAIRTANTKAQYYLCAYCCCEISGRPFDTMNEHIIAQSTDGTRTLDFDNIIASCTTRNQCDQSHGSQHIPLTPLMDECETELKYMLSGRVLGSTERAKETLRVLNLGDDEANNRSLIGKRKQFIDAMLYANGVDPSEGLEDDELIEILLEDIQKIEGGKMLPFAPALASVIRGWLQLE